jgi:hypothetical protein
MEWMKENWWRIFYFSRNKEGGINFLDRKIGLNFCPKLDLKITDNV